MSETEKRNSEQQPLHQSQQVTVVIANNCNAKENGVKEKVEVQPPDGGLSAWLVCATSFWVNGALFGVINNFGVVYVYLEKLFSDGSNNSSAISLVGSLCVGMTFLFSFVAAILTDSLGIRKTSLAGSLLVLAGMLASSFATSLEVLYVTYGVLFGVGASLAYTPSLVILGHYFKKRLSLVNGIVATGSSISTVGLPFLLAFLLDTFGLSDTYKLLLILMAPLLATFFIFRPLLNVKEKGTSFRSSCHNAFLNVSIWKNKKYLVWAISFPVCLFGYFVPYVHLVKHTQDILPGYNGGALITCIGAASGVGRLVFGLVADIPGISRILLQQISFFSIGILTMLISVANAYWILVVICLGMGLFDGCFITLLGPIAFDIVGTKRASQAIGSLLGLCAVPLTLGPPIAGWMYDHMDKNYKYAFIAAGIPPIVGALLMFCIKLVKDTEETIAEESKESDGMLKSSETKESKINDDAHEESSAVWKRREVDNSNIDPESGVKLLGIKPKNDEESNVSKSSEMIERHSTC